MKGFEGGDLNSYPFIDTDRSTVVGDPCEPHMPSALLAVFINDIPTSTTVDYIVRRLSTANVHGGPEFLVRTFYITETDDQTILLLDCDNDRLLREAERCSLKKRAVSSGDVLPFIRRNPQSDHYIFGDLTRLLVGSEKIRLAMQILSRVCVNSQDLCENPDLKLGEPLVSQLSVIGIISDILCLHDIRQLNALGSEWYGAKLTTLEPCYDRIRDYFGEKISIYFAFLGYYTKALILPSCLALYNCLLWFQTNNLHAQAPFAAFNLIYLTIFLKFWKRQCSSLAYRWGTLGFAKYEMCRPDFKGTLQLSPVTGRMEMWYPSSSRIRIMVCETYHIVALCLLLAVIAMWGYFGLQLYVEKHFAQWTWRDIIVLNLPTIVYSLLIEVSNPLYRKLAQKLTFRENHRLPSEHEYHLLLKLISFQFVNCFVFLFYVAFILQDMDRLRRYLACCLITLQIVQQIFECVIPFIRIYLSKQYTLLKIKRDGSNVNVNSIALEAKLDIYGDTFDDYLEMWCQFGYAFMFSSVFPLAAFYALANNLMELRTDAFKICVTMRRPFPEMADSMGIWQRMLYNVNYFTVTAMLLTIMTAAFDAIIVVSIMTNCALLGMTAANHSLYFRKWPLWHIVVLFVIVENSTGMLDIGQVSHMARRSKPVPVRRVSVSFSPVL